MLLTLLSLIIIIFMVRSLKFCFSHLDTLLGKEFDRLLGREFDRLLGREFCETKRDSTISKF